MPLLIRIFTFICVLASPIWRAKVISEVKTEPSTADSKYSAPMTIAEAAERVVGMMQLLRYHVVVEPILVQWTISDGQW